LGECWSHGQICRPADLPKKGKVKQSILKPSQQRSGGGGGRRTAPTQTGKGGGAGQAGQWMWIPAGVSNMNMMAVKEFGKQGQQQNRGDDGGDGPKNRLNRALTLLLERSVTKEDLVYEMSEENNKHVAVLKVPALSTEWTEFKGKPGLTKRDAQVNAAQKALNVLSKEIKEATTAHEAVQEEKRKARAAIMKDKRQAKKAAKEAEGGAVDQLK